MSSAAHRWCNTSTTPPSNRSLATAPPERDHRAKRLVRVLSPQQQSTVPVGGPSAILTLELGRHHSTIGVPGGRGPIFPPPRRPSAAARDPDSTFALSWFAAGVRGAGVSRSLTRPGSQVRRGAHGDPCLVEFVQAVLVHSERVGLVVVIDRPSVADLGDALADLVDAVVRGRLGPPRRLVQP